MIIEGKLLKLPFENAAKISANIKHLTTYLSAIFYQMADMDEANAYIRKVYNKDSNFGAYIYEVPLGLPFMFGIIKGEPIFYEAGREIRSPIAIKWYKDYGNLIIEEMQAHYDTILCHGVLISPSFTLKDYNTDYSTINDFMCLGISIDFVLMPPVTFEALADSLSIPILNDGYYTATFSDDIVKTPRFTNSIYSHRTHSCHLEKVYKPKLFIIYLRSSKLTFSNKLPVLYLATNDFNMYKYGEYILNKLHTKNRPSRYTRLKIEPEIPRIVNNIKGDRTNIRKEINELYLSKGYNNKQIRKIQKQVTKYLQEVA